MKKRKISAWDYIAYACSAIVYILPQYLLSSYLSAYYTDVALVSAGAVGSIVLAMRVTDGISDILMGRVIDRTHSRWGKARPWILVGTLGLAVTLLSLVLNIVVTVCLYCCNVDPEMETVKRELREGTENAQ